MSFTEFEPPTNCGFTADGTGWVRLWLVNDSLNSAGVDLFAVSGRFYPLNVAKYAFDGSTANPGSLSFEESPNLGGYTRSMGLDESPYTDLPANVGFYATSNVHLHVAHRGESSAREVDLSAGDFYAQDVAAVGQVDYLFLVMA